jgi:hypothetical protein
MIAVIGSLLLIHEPKLDWDEDNEQLLLWYNTSKHQRTFILLFPFY